MKMTSMAAALAILVFGLLVSTPEAEAAKPDRCSPWPECRDYEPPPPASECAGEDFPAFAYSKGIYEGRKGSLSGFGLYLSNSDGSCEVQIFTNNERESLNISYRQDGDHGRMVWTQGTESGLGKRDPDRGRAVVKMIDFTVTATGGVTGVSVSTLVMEPDDGPSAIGTSELSPDLNTVYYNYGNPNGRHLKSIDISSCSSGCTPNILDMKPPGDPAYSWHHLELNPAGDRLYFSTSGVWEMGYYNVDANGVDVDNPGIVSRRFDFDLEDFSKHSAISVTTNSLGKEVVAIQYNTGVIRLIDVEDCATGNFIGLSCALTGASTFQEDQGISGSSVSFDGEGNLLVGSGYFEGDVDYYDTATGLSDFSISGATFPDSAL